MGAVDKAADPPAELPLSKRPRASAAIPAATAEPTRTPTTTPGNAPPDDPVVNNLADGVGVCVEG
jgi:hypothetical protein